MIDAIQREAVARHAWLYSRLYPISGKVKLQDIIKGVMPSSHRASMLKRHRRDSGNANEYMDKVLYICCARGTCFALSFDELVLKLRYWRTRELRSHAVT